jgi:hypothetical protein
MRRMLQGLGNFQYVCENQNQKLMKNTLVLLLLFICGTLTAQRTMQKNDLSPVKQAAPVLPDTSTAGDNLIEASNTYFASVALGMVGAGLLAYGVSKGDEGKTMVIAGAATSFISLIFQGTAWVKIKKAGLKLKKNKL